MSALLARLSEHDICALTNFACGLEDEDVLDDRAAEIERRVHQLRVCERDLRLQFARFKQAQAAMKAKRTRQTTDAFFCAATTLEARKIQTERVRAAWHRAKLGDDEESAKLLRDIEDLSLDIESATVKLAKTFKGFTLEEAGAKPTRIMPTRIVPREKNTPTQSEIDEKKRSSQHDFSF